MPITKPYNPDIVQTVLAACDRLEGPLLPVLQGVQAAFGYIPDQAIAPIALALGLSQAEVFGVISFYPALRCQAPGRHIVQICRAEACQAVGGRELEAAVKNHLALDFHQRSADGAITLESVYCLGNCACGPSLRVDERILGRVDPTKANAVLAALSQEGEEQ